MQPERYLLESYLKDRIQELKNIHNRAFIELDAIHHSELRKMQWRLIHDLKGRYEELEEALKVLNGGKSIYQ